MILQLERLFFCAAYEVAPTLAAPRTKQPISHGQPCGYAQEEHRDVHPFSADMVAALLQHREQQGVFTSILELLEKVGIHYNTALLMS